MAYENQRVYLEQQRNNRQNCSYSVVSVIEVMKKKKMKVQHRQEFSTSIKVNH